MDYVMRKTSTILLACTAAVISACAAHPDPIIDMKGVNEATMQADWNECESYSEQVKIGQGAAKGAA